MNCCNDAHIKINIMISFKTVETPIHLIKITGYVSYMNPKQYIQEVSYNSLTNRYYVTRQKKSDGLSISAKRCIKLASGILFLPK